MNRVDRLILDLQKIEKDSDGVLALAVATLIHDATLELNRLAGVEEAANHYLDAFEEAAPMNDGKLAERNIRRNNLRRKLGRPQKTRANASNQRKRGQRK